MGSHMDRSKARGDRPLFVAIRRTIYLLRRLLIVNKLRSISWSLASLRAIRLWQLLGGISYPRGCDFYHPFFFVPGDDDPDVAVGPKALKPAVRESIDAHCFALLELGHLYFAFGLRR